jgi:3-hydroxybutyryl-CoA dehydratase
MLATASTSTYPIGAAMKFPSVDQEHRLVLQVTAEDVQKFSELSGDRAPLHTDHEFATTHGFDGTVVHGALLGAYVSQLVGMFLPGPLSVMERIDLGFRRPCIAPCELHLRARVRQVSEAVASVVMDVVVSDADQQVLASGKTWHKILREAE